MLSKKLSFLMLMCAVVGFLPGCGSGASGVAVPQEEKVNNPVGGQVIMKNRSPIRTMVRFYREDVTDIDAPTARAVCDEQGYFDMSSNRTKDGVLPGRYKVLITLSGRPAEGGNRPSKVEALGGVYNDINNPKFIVDIPKGGKSDLSFEVEALPKEEVDALLAEERNFGKPPSREESGKNADN